MKVGDRVKAFHPQTIGVIYPGKVISVQPGVVRVEFSTSIKKKKNKFWIPVSHITEIMPL